MHEPKEYGRKVQHQFIYAAMPRCNYNVLDAYNTYYKNALVSPCLKTLRAWWRNFQDNRELLVDTVARVRDERQRERKPARKDAMPGEGSESLRVRTRCLTKLWNVSGSCCVISRGCTTTRSWRSYALKATSTAWRPSVERFIFGSTGAGTR